MMNSNSPHRSYIFVCRLLAGLLLAAWLAPAAHGDGWPFWPFNREDKPGKPDKIIALWSDTVLTQTGQPPIRGFGGRLMFYEGKKEEPIKVEGTLVVYAFDETDRDAEQHPARPQVCLHAATIAAPLQQIEDRPFLQRVAAVGRGGRRAERNHAHRPLPTERGHGSHQRPLPATASRPNRRRPGPQLPDGAALPGPASGPAGRARPLRQARGADCDGGGVQPAAYQMPSRTATQRRPPSGSSGDSPTTTIDVPSGSAIRSAITSPQACRRQPAVSPGCNAGHGPSVPAAKRLARRSPIALRGDHRACSQIRGRRLPQVDGGTRTNVPRTIAELCAAELRR